jgi:hypothetical protein
MAEYLKRNPTIEDAAYICRALALLYGVGRFAQSGKLFASVETRTPTTVLIFGKTGGAGESQADHGQEGPSRLS